MKLSLTIIGGTRAGEMLRFDPPRQDHSAPIQKWIIGRQSTDELSLADRQMSRQHFCLFYADDHWILKDIDSANGTLCNGVKIKQTALNDQDHITAGHTRFRVQISE